MSRSFPRSKEVISSVQTVVRVLDTLRVVGQHPRGVPLGELAIATGIPVSTTHRIATSLVQEGFLAVAPENGGYMLGRELIALAVEASADDIQGAARRPIRDLADETSETAFITKLVGNSAVCIGLVEGKRAVRLFVSVGQELPLHGTAAARCLLAGLPPGRVLSMVSEASIVAAKSPQVRNLDQLLERLGTIRDRGYEISADELDDYAWAVAAPIVSRTGDWIASLTLTTPMPLIKQPGYERYLIDSVCSRAKEISTLLGAASSS